MEDLGHSRCMACKVPFGTLGHAPAAPGNEDMLRKARVWVFDFDEGVLNAALAEIFNEFVELAICGEKSARGRYT